MSKNRNNPAPMFESLEHRSLMSASLPGPQPLNITDLMVSSYSAPASKPGATELSATRSADTQTQGIIAILIGL